MIYIQFCHPLFLLLTITAALFSGCSRTTQHSSLDDIDVTFVLDDQYEDKIKGWRISPKEAAQAVYALSLKQKNEIGGFLGAHLIIVETEYVFAPHHKNGISLNGIYIDGNSGVIRVVEDGGVIPWDRIPDWRRRLGLANESDLDKIYLNVLE